VLSKRKRHRVVKVKVIEAPEHPVTAQAVEYAAELFRANGVLRSRKVWGSSLGTVFDDWQRARRLSFDDERWRRSRR